MDGMSAVAQNGNGSGSLPGAIAVPTVGSSAPGPTSALSTSYESAISSIAGDEITPVSAVDTAASTSGPASATEKKDTPGRRAMFMILRQKYLELLEAGQTNRALKVLRIEVAPVTIQPEKLHALSG